MPLTLVSLRRSWFNPWRNRESIGVARLVPKPETVLIEPAQGLLKERGFRVAGRDGALQDIELIFVHVD